MAFSPAMSNGDLSAGIASPQAIHGASEWIGLASQTQQHLQRPVMWISRRVIVYSYRSESPHFKLHRNTTFQMVAADCGSPNTLSPRLRAGALSKGQPSPASIFDKLRPRSQSREANFHTAPKGALMRCILSRTEVALGLLI